MYAISSDIEELFSELQAIDLSPYALAADLTSLQGEVDTNESDIDGLQSSLASLQSEVDSTQASIGLDTDGSYAVQGSNTSTSISSDIGELFDSAPVSVSASSPTDPKEGDLWWDTEDLALRVYYGNSTETTADDVWVETSSSSFVNQVQSSSLPSRTVVNTDAMNVSVGDKTLNDGDYALGSIEGFKSYSLLQVDVSHADLWVVLYTDSNSMANDVSRTDINVDPIPGSGVIAEFRSNSDNQSIKVTPTVLGFNLDSTVSNKIYLRVKNISGDDITDSFSISLTLLQMEE